VEYVPIVIAVVVIALVIALVVLAARRNRRRSALRERFGPEYDEAVKRGKDRRAVEQRLEALARRRDALEIHDVEPQEHERFAQRWDAAQLRFVDDPGQAVADADALVNDVLRSRGYPVETFDDRAALVATDHQDVVEGYRRAHDTFAAHLQGGSGDTEELRQAFVAYREVFAKLNVPAEHPVDGDAHAGSADVPAPAVSDDAVPADARPVDAVPADRAPAVREVEASAETPAERVRTEPEVRSSSAEPAAAATDPDGAELPERQQVAARRVEPQ
jgi:hypothetical protein